MTDEAPQRRAGDTDARKKPVTVEDLERVVAGLRRQLRYMWGLWAFLALLVAGVGGFLLHEGAVRADGQCQIFEGAQLDENEELADTYQYLYRAQQHPQRVDTDLYEFALARLPVTKAKAMEDQAPGYCDEDGVGLPEPDPTLPEPPKGLKLPELPPPG